MGTMISADFLDTPFAAPMDVAGDLTGPARYPNSAPVPQS